MGSELSSRLGGVALSRSGVEWALAEHLLKCASVAERRIQSLVARLGRGIGTRLLFLVVRRRASQCWIDGRCSFAETLTCQMHSGPSRQCKSGCAIADGGRVVVDMDEWSCGLCKTRFGSRWNPGRRAATGAVCRRDRSSEVGRPSLRDLGVLVLGSWCWQSQRARTRMGEMGVGVELLLPAP